MPTSAAPRPRALRLLTLACAALIVASCSSEVAADDPPRPTFAEPGPSAQQVIEIPDGEMYFEETQLMVVPAPEKAVEEPEAAQTTDPSPEASTAATEAPAAPGGAPRPSPSPRGDQPPASPAPGAPGPGPAVYSGPTVGGFFVFTSSNPTAMRSTVEGIRSTGADTVITFGSRMRPASVTGNRPSAPGFDKCVVAGQGCLSVLGRPLGRVFTYEDKGGWAPSAFSCPGDQTITSDSGQLYSLIVLPVNGDCYNHPDVVVTLDFAGERNANRTMIETAAAHGMVTFVGLPAPVMRSDTGWLPDLSYARSLELFTERFVANYATYGPGFGGFYHHVEMPLKTSGSWSDVRNLYAMQNAAIARISPGRPAMISPYIDARRSFAANTPLGDIAQATTMLAATSHGTPLIIAPQDGQGTGKVGAFDPSRAGEQVDQPSAAIAGSGTYADVYLGSTADYMRQVVAGGAGASIWVNLELMSASTSGAPACEGASNGRGATTIDRVREQARLGAVPGVTKTIGFMWQPYALCGSPSLADMLR